MMQRKWRKFFIEIIPFAILCLGYYEAVIGVLQWVGIMHTHHYGYAFTGSFYNPGPYACFLSMMVPVALSMMTGHNHWAKRWGGMVMVLMCAVLVPATLSRTAIVACAVGTAVVLWESIRQYLKKRRTPVMICVAAIAIASACLYTVKKDSADGRMLMWKVAAQSAIDVPHRGVGWDNVAGEYGEAQERYFASREATEEERFVADAPEYVFNEYLQVAIAFGPFATVLMVTVLVGGIAVAFRNLSFGMAGSAAAVAIVMFASYPLQFPVFAVAIGIVL